MGLIRLSGQRLNIHVTNWSEELPGAGALSSRFLTSIAARLIIWSRDASSPRLSPDGTLPSLETAYFWLGREAASVASVSQSTSFRPRFAESTSESPRRLAGPSQTSIPQGNTRRFGMVGRGRSSSLIIVSQLFVCSSAASQSTTMGLENTSDVRVSRARPEAGVCSTRSSTGTVRETGASSETRARRGTASVSLRR